MSSLWTSEAAAAATGGTARGNWSVNGLSIDSRSILPGEMFVALKDQRDGHDFVGAAFAAGAGAALVSHVPEGVPDDAPLLVVEDVLVALEELGRAARARTKARVVGITGSVGKTSTKEMLRAILERQGKCHVAESSFNNHWGVPLTLARMPADADFAVIEIGMNAPGEIAPLAQMARPHVAIITNIEAAHLQAFEDLNGIAREKASIFTGLEADGVAIFYGDQPTSALIADLASAAGVDARHRVTFGAGADNAVRATSVRLSGDTTIIQGVFEGEAFLGKLASPGRHFAMNALAALAALPPLGADFDIALSDLWGWQVPGGRGKREVICLDVVEDELRFSLYDDAFNANPTSIGAALEVLASAQPFDGAGRIREGRRIAILGDMLELGPDEVALHADLANLPAMDTVHLVHTVGPLMEALHDALPDRQRGRHFERAEDAVLAAHRLIDAGDVVLVKGSKGSRVSLVVDALRKLGHPLADQEDGDA